PVCISLVTGPIRVCPRRLKAPCSAAIAPPRRCLRASEPCERARANGAGMWGPASERVGGSAGAKPPGLTWVGTPHEVGHRSLPGTRAEGPEPALVHQHARP